MPYIVMTGPDTFQYYEDDRPGSEVDVITSEEAASMGYAPGSMYRQDDPRRQKQAPAAAAAAPAGPAPASAPAEAPRRTPSGMLGGGGGGAPMPTGGRAGATPPPSSLAGFGGGGGSTPMPPSRPLNRPGEAPLPTSAAPSGGPPISDPTQVADINRGLGMIPPSFGNPDRMPGLPRTESYQPSGLQGGRGQGYRGGNYNSMYGPAPGTPPPGGNEPPYQPSGLQGGRGRGYRGGSYNSMYGPPPGTPQPGVYGPNPQNVQGTLGTAEPWSSPFSAQTPSSWGTGWASQQMAPQQQPSVPSITINVPSYQSPSSMPDNQMPAGKQTVYDPKTDSWVLR